MARRHTDIPTYRRRPHYGRGTLGYLVVQVLRDAGVGGLTVTEIIEAARRGGRVFPSAGAAWSGARNVLAPSIAQQKLQADAYFKRMDDGLHTCFMNQRWTLRFDALDLTGVDPTPGQGHVGVPGVAASRSPFGRRDYVGSKVLRKTRDGRAVRGFVSEYDPTLKFDSDEPNGYKVMYDDGRSEWLQENVLLDVLLPEEPIVIVAPARAGAKRPAPADTPSLPSRKTARRMSIDEVVVERALDADEAADERLRQAEIRGDVIEISDDDDDDVMLVDDSNPRRPTQPARAEPPPAAAPARPPPVAASVHPASSMAVWRAATKRARDELVALPNMLLDSTAVMDALKAAADSCPDARVTADVFAIMSTIVYRGPSEVQSRARLGDLASLLESTRREGDVDEDELDESGGETEVEEVFDFPDEVDISPAAEISSPEPFTVAALLAALRPDPASPVLENDRLQGLAPETTLRRYQSAAVRWMLSRETVGGRGGGGALCDSMGLGKTVCVIALALARACPADHLDDLNPPVKTEGGRGDSERYQLLPPVRRPLAKTNLIISPQSICQQWENEIKRHAPGLKVLVYDGRRTAAETVSARRMATYDVVLTTYEILKSEIHYSEECSVNLRHSKKYKSPLTPLVRLKFWRCFLDEAQMIEQPASASAAMALKVAAKTRWVVTGTPVSKSVDDLYALLLFLRRIPNHRGAWRAEFVAPFEAKTPGAGRKLARKLRPVFWRHTNESVAEWLQLPPQTVVERSVEFERTERHHYDRCLVAARGAVADAEKNAERQGDRAKREAAQTAMLSELTALRQLCSHPLVGTSAVDGQNKGEGGSMADVSKALFRSARRAWLTSERRMAAAMLEQALLNRRKEDPASSSAQIQPALQKVADLCEWHVSRQPDEYDRRVDPARAHLNLSPLSGYYGELKKWQRLRLGVCSFIPGAAFAARVAESRASLFGDALEVFDAQEKSAKDTIDKTRVSFEACWEALRTVLSDMSKIVVQEEAVDKPPPRDVITDEEALADLREKGISPVLIYSRVTDDDDDERGGGGGDDDDDDFDDEDAPQHRKINTAAANNNNNMEGRPEPGNNGKAGVEYMDDEKTLALAKRLKSLDSLFFNARSARRKLVEVLHYRMFQQQYRMQYGSFYTGRDNMDPALVNDIVHDLKVMIGNLNDTLAEIVPVVKGLDTKGTNEDIQREHPHLSKVIADLYSEVTAASEAADALTAEAEAICDVAKGFVLIETALNHRKPAEVWMDSYVIPRDFAELAAQGGEGSELEQHVNLGEGKVDTYADCVSYSSIQQPMHELEGHLRDVVSRQVTKSSTEVWAALFLEDHENPAEVAAKRCTPNGFHGKRIKFVPGAAFTLIPDASKVKTYAQAAKEMAQVGRVLDREAVAFRSALRARSHLLTIAAQIEQIQRGELEAADDDADDASNEDDDIDLTASDDLTEAEVRARKLARLTRRVARLTALADVAKAKSRRAEELHASAKNNSSFGTKLDEVVGIMRGLEADVLAGKPGGGKAVIFSQWRATLELVGAALKANNIQWVNMQGTKNLKTAQARFSADPNCRAFLLHAGSAAAGLTLVDAQTVILLEPLLNPAIELQAVGRVRRIGQKLPTRVIKLAVKGTVDERVATLCEKRLDAHRAEGRAAEGGGGDLASADKALERFSEDDLRFVFA